VTHSLPILVAGWWVPPKDARTHRMVTTPCRRDKRPIIDGRPEPQARQIKMALALLPEHRRRLAVDVGAHVGFWSGRLVKEFERVLAVEPQEDVADCLTMNAVSPGLRVEYVLAGARRGKADVVSPPDQTLAGHSTAVPMVSSCWSSRAVERWTVAKDVPVVPLDEDPWVAEGPVDLLKIDAEGMDLDVLRGAERAILRDKPVIVVEQIKTDAAVRWLVERGAVLRDSLDADQFLSWPSSA
jgi:FkbM family methyltransferase